jgi:hypothetical protein
MDSYDVTITVKTSSINGRQNGDEIERFTADVLKLAKELLSASNVEVDVVKHRLIHGWGSVE